MKEQILHLDPHDDFISARDKMGWVQTQRVYLIWPPHGRVLARPLDLLLLHRHAHRLGAQLALITTDPVVREEARTLKLPVFATLEDSREQKWRTPLPAVWGPTLTQRPRLHAPPSRPAPRPPARWPRWVGIATRLMVFVLACLSLLAVAVMLWPEATLTLQPAAQPVHVPVSLLADPALTEPTAGRVPARSVRVELELSGVQVTTGARTVPANHATGAVVFTNLTGAALTLPANLSLRTTGGQAVRFITTERATLEPRLGATTNVRIRAVDLGPVGNVAAGQINAVDGPLGLQVAVANPQATRGGRELPRAAVTAADADTLRQSVLAQAFAEATFNALQAQLQPGELLVTQTLTLTQVTQETLDPPVGAVAEAVRLTARVQMTALAVNEAQAQAAAQTALQASVPADQNLLPNTLTFSRLSAFALNDQGQPTFALTASAQTVPSINREAVRAGLVGQTPATATRQVLSQLTLNAAPRLTLAPAWWAEWVNRLPLTPYRITIVVE